MIKMYLPYKMAFWLGSILFLFIGIQGAWAQSEVMLQPIVVSTQPSIQQATQEYKVGVGDILAISVIGHDELTTTDIVSPDGTIGFPYISTIKVEGKTFKEISTELSQALSPKYIQFPEIIVRLQEPKSLKFYVYGEVRNPGVFRLEKNMTVLKAISMSGGYSPFANKRLIKILHPKVGVPGYNSMSINLEDVVKNPSGNNDMFINNEDIVVVVQK